MPFFSSKAIRGRVYELSHLEPFVLDVDADGRRYHVRIEFSSHCFTTTLGPEHTPDLRYAHAGEVRAFDVERYQLSLKLPDLIRALGGRTVYHSHQDNFFTLRDESVPGGKAPYVVFFKPYRARDQKIHVRLTIQSAYLKPGMSMEASSIRFATLIRFTSEGRKPKYGPRVRIKRA